MSKKKRRSHTSDALSYEDGLMFIRLQVSDALRAMDLHAVVSLLPVDKMFSESKDGSCSYPLRGFDAVHRCLVTYYNESVAKWAVKNNRPIPQPIEEADFIMFYN